MEAEVQQFVEARGYKEYTSRLNHEGERTFQLIIREEEGKRFVNIHAWDLRSVRADFGIKYNVEAVFETEGNAWFEMKFYGLKKDVLIQRLSEFEGEVADIFKLLGGVHQ